MDILLSLLGSESVLKRMICSIEEKEQILKTIDLLCEMTKTSREFGYASLISNYSEKIKNEFFLCALTLLIDAKSSDLMIECCVPYLLTSGIEGMEFCEDYIILVGLSKIIQGENPECLEIELESYLGILCADKILA